MQNETKKFKVKRELKSRISANEYRLIKSALVYGNGPLLKEATGISYHAIANIAKTKLATATTLSKVLAGIELLNQQKAAA